MVGSVEVFSCVKYHVSLSPVWDLGYMETTEFQKRYIKAFMSSNRLCWMCQY